MSEGANEPIEIRVRVGDLEYVARTEYVSFRGTELRRISAVMESRPDFQRTRHYTLYETPDEGLKVHELETVREGSMEGQPGQPPAEVRKVAGRLFTEEDLRHERPEIAQNLLGGN